MVRRELVRTGERVEVRLRFLGRPEEIDRVELAFWQLRGAGYNFSGCRIPDGMDWYLEDEVEAGKQPMALYVGRWCKSEKYYGKLRRKGHAWGQRGMLREAAGLYPVKPNYPGVFSRCRSRLSEHLIMLLQHRANRSGSIARKVLLLLLDMVDGRKNRLR